MSSLGNAICYSCVRQTNRRRRSWTRSRPTLKARLLLCARQELLLAIRSRWTQIFAVVFALLALAVASSGYVLSGGSGVQDFARTAVSLVLLVLLLVPLSALLIGVQSLVPERGAAELLFSQPVSRRDVLLGQTLGLLAALVAAEAVGSASLAFLRFTKGPVGAACLLSLSVLLWIALPFAAATRRLGKADL